ncbi:MAG: isoprenylcysteine carboxylmethyltransferase family protein [Candidatus Acidiferrales bacterium]
MRFIADAPTGIAFFVVGACWVGFGAILVVGKRGASKTQTRQDAKSHLGFFLQGVAYAICLAFPRGEFVPFAPASKMAEEILSAAAAAMAIASVWFCYAAARALGKQWALVARVVEGHELITEGPYGIVRNPIYLAMFGMLVATGLAVSRWQALAGAIILFFVGTEIRIRSEERLLREAFGATFGNYARRVPALFPRMF